MAALLCGIWWVWWKLPQRYAARLAIQNPYAKSRADVEDNFRKTVSQALGGAAVLIGAGAAYLQFTLQQQASHDLLISNQVSKGFEQLASNNITMRLGGLYALEGVMNTSLDYHQPVLEALCAFVRDGTSVDLARASIPGALLFRADLDGADLNGAHMHGADLNNAHLNGTDLSGADLSGAKLSGAQLSGAELRGAKLSGANLSGAELSRESLVYVIFNRAKLDRAHLVDAYQADANLAGAQLSRADLSDAHLAGQAQLDQACGTDAKLPPGLTLKPCPAEPVAPPLNPRAMP